MELCHGPRVRVRVRVRVSCMATVHVNGDACECGEVLVVASPLSAEGPEHAGDPWAPSQVLDR